MLKLLEENSFDVLLTADANIKTQQNIENRNTSILVLRAFNNRLKTHAEMIEDIHKTLSKIKEGEIIEIFHRDMKDKLK
ncbi:MAG: hypothetical protein ACR2MD_14560 [Aridibacter sp.]